MNDDIIIVKQLPMIEERLQQIKGAAQEKVQAALALACTANTVKKVKEIRADLRKDFDELEQRRIDVKNQIMRPYEDFEKIYRDCVTDVFVPADKDLKARIDEVEDTIKGEKADEVKAYFEECAAAKGIDFLDFSLSGITVTKTASLTSLKKQATTYVNNVVQALELIETYPEDIRPEILVEYKRTLHIAQAITEVMKRRKAIEEEIALCADMQEQEERQDTAVRMVEEALAPPTQQGEEQESEDQHLYEASFRVAGTFKQIKALKEFLVQGGYDYEQF